MSGLLLVLLFLLIGMFLQFLSLWQKRNPAATTWTIALPENLADSLTSFVLYISLPATILVGIPGIQVSSELLVPMILPWMMLAVAALFVVMVSRMLHWNRETAGLMLLLVPLGNTSFLGIPMVETFFGPDHVRYAVLYDQVGTFLALATYGGMVAAKYGRSQGLEGSNMVNLSQTSRVLLRVAAFPPFLALMLSLSTLGVEHPRSIGSMLEGLSSTLVPLVMIAVGFNLKLRLKGRHRVPLTAGLFLKLILTPLIALAACRAFSLDGPEVDVAIFETGMPSQVAAWAVASKAGLEPELGAAMVGFGILFSFLTLPILFQFL